MRTMLRTAFLAAAMALAWIAASQAQEARIALVIGNSSYATAPLPNPVNDARLISAALQAQGFEVIERTDVSQKEMKRAVKEFGDRLEAARGEAVGLFYYAGHGVQVDGLNYLIPVDAEIESEGDVDIESMSVDSVLASIAYARNPVNIVILDACRNNPFARGFRSPGRGLANVTAQTKGTLIAFATSPGDVALDGEGANSPYSKALAAAFTMPGVPIEKMFRNVRDAVLEETDGRQTPWESSSLVGADFYLVPAQVEVAEGPEVETPTVDAPAFDLAFWDSIKNSTNPADFEDYIAQFPNGGFVRLANRRMAELRERGIVVVPEPEITVDNNPQAMVTVQNTNVRAGPGTEFDTVISLPAGTVVEVVGRVRDADWYRITTPDGGAGYVQLPLLGELGEQPDTVETAVIPVPHPDTSVSEVHVDAAGGRDYRTIQEAIEVAGPNATIYVHPGTYRDGMLIDKTVEIIGVGERDEIRVEVAGADAAWFQGGDGKLANMTLRQMGDGNWFGIDISAGRPTIENVDISSQSLSNIAIRDGADPVVRDSTIHDGAQAGINIYDGGRGTIENNDIYGNANAGVIVETLAGPVIRSNRIHDGQESGILIGDGGRASIDDNDIVDNANAGIVVNADGSPTVTNNRINRNAYEAIWVRTGGGGRFEGNDLRDNVRGPWDIEEGSGPIHRTSNIPEDDFVSPPPVVAGASEIHVDAAGGRDYRSIQVAIDAAGPGSTIHVHPGTYSEGLIITKTLDIVGVGDRADIVIESNGADAAWFQGGDGRIANMTLRQIGGGNWYGIDISAGNPTVENVDLSSQSLANIAIREGANPTVRDSRIHDSPESGIYIYDNGRGRIENNDINDNGKAGITVDSGGRPTVIGNRVTGSGYEGVWIVAEAAGGRFENNDLRGNGRGAWDIEDGAGPIIRVGNQPDDGEGGGEDTPPPVASAGELHVDAAGGRDYRIIQEAIDAAGEGTTIYVHPGTYTGGMLIEKTVEIVGVGQREDVLVEVSGADVAWFQGGDGRLANMTLRQMGGGNWYGIDISAGNPTIENVDLSSQSLANIAIRDGADPYVILSRLHDSPESGIYIYDNGRGTIENNDIYDNGKAGVTLDSGADPTVIGNTITGSGYEGVWVVSGTAGGRFEDNDLRGNGRGAWDIEDGAGPIIRSGNLPDDGPEGDAPPPLPDVADAGTFYVDPAGDRGYSTIQGAIDAATDGAEILVFPGTYTAGMIIDKSVMIIGNGERDEVVVEVSGADVAWFQGGDGRLANMTLRQMGGGNWYGIDISAGNPTIENIDLASQSLANIAIRDGADPTIRDSNLHDSPESGVYIYDNGRGTIENNDIYDNEKAGISVASGANPVVRDNRVAGNGYEAVWVLSDAGGGRFEDNDLRGNGRGAWDIEDGTGPIIRSGNLPDDGPEVGNMPPHVVITGDLHVDAAGGRDFTTLQEAIDAASEGATIHVHPGTYTSGMLIDKTLDIVGTGTRDEVRVEVAGADVAWYQGGNGRLANMTLRQMGDGSWYGIDISAGNPTIENVDIASRSLANIAIRNDADPIVRDSRLHDSPESGVYIYDNGRGTIENNEIYDNGKAGITLDSGADPVVLGNRVTGSGYEGVWVVSGAAGGRFEDNDLRGNGRGAWDIEDGAGQIFRTGNLPDDGPGGGEVPVASAGELHVDAAGGRDYRTLQQAIDAADDGTTIYVHPGTYREGMLIDETIEIVGVGARDEVVVEVSGADVAWFQGGDGRLANMTLRQMGDGSWFGIDISAGNPTIENVDLSSQSLAAIAIHNGTDPVVRHSLIHGSPESGVYVYDNGRGTIENNEIYDNAGAGISVASGANPVVLGNRISGNAYEGVWVLSDAAGGRFENNDLRGNGRGAWDIEAGSGLVVRAGNITDDGGDDIPVAGADELHVDAAGGRDFTTLQEAIDAASEGATIHVHPGTYTAGMLIDKTLDIVGTGTRDEVRVEVSGADVAWYQGGDGRLANMTLRQMGDGNWFGIDIAAGNPTIENVDLASRSLAAIAIHDGADPVVRDSRIHDSPESGLYIYDNGRGTIVNNDIYDNGKAGITLDSGADPVVLGNRVTGSAYEGVWVVSGAAGGRFEDNDLRGNGRGAWDIEDGAGQIFRTGNLPDDGPGGGEVPMVGADELHVDAAGGRDYRTLQEAIDAAAEGATIYVHPGTYTAGMLIDKTVDIVGTGEREDVLVEVSGADVAWFQGGDGRLANMTLRQMGDGSWFGIDISAGNPTIENVDLSSQSLANIAIHDGADPIVRESRLHDSPESGIYIFDNGRGTIVNNDITDNAKAGISVDTGADPVVTGNRITGSGYEGVWVLAEAAGGRFEDNDLRGNARGAWDIEDGAGPVIRDGNQTDGGKGDKAEVVPPQSVSGEVHVDAAGGRDFRSIQDAIDAAEEGTTIHVHPGIYAEGLLIDKTVEVLGTGSRDEVVIEVSGADVVWFQGGNGKLANMTLRQLGDGDWYGIDISADSPIIENMDVSSQSLAGIAIHDGADPLLRDNVVHHGNESGIYVYDDGRGTIEGNDIYNNAYAGIAIRNGGDPVVRRNTIRDGQESGLHIYEEGFGTIEDNEISGNALAGIEIKGGSNPTVRGNRIYDGKVSGIYVHENGAGTIENNEIFANAYSGIELKDGANPIVRKNTIRDAGENGIFVNNDGRGMILNNDIRDNAHAGIVVHEGGNPLVRGNRINGNGYEAVWVRAGGSGKFVNNDLSGNVRGDWDIEEGAGEVIRADNRS
jgi:parallel beta-helix repeat protein